MATTAAETAIRARRKLTNRLIAEHQAARLKPFFTEDAVVIVGDGEMILGGEAVVAAFEGQFRDRNFMAFVRLTQTVEVAEGGQRAAEHGHWTGTWKGGIEVSGTYLAAWRSVHGQWVIERELFVTLAG